MTVLEVIQRSAEFLGRHEVESPRLQIELLLAHVLKLPRLKLYLNFDRQLADPELTQLREMVKRRSQREPLQHITGSTSFCGLEIAVNRHVLVPRPETELLAELGWEFLQSEIRNPKSETGGGALDFGTGSGCLAIALAAHCPTARIEALDISAEALAVARQNAAANNVAGRIEFFHGDGFEALASQCGATPDSSGSGDRHSLSAHEVGGEGRAEVGSYSGQSDSHPPHPSPLPVEGRGSKAPTPHANRYHLIISNPPYIPSAEIATLDPEVRDFDPRQALDGGADGLAFYRRLAGEAGGFLAAGGKLMCEFGDGQGPTLRELFAGQMWVVEQVRADYSARERILVARRAA